MSDTETHRHKTWTLSFMVDSPCFLLPSQVVHLVYPGLAEHPHPVLVALHGPVGGGDGQQELSQLLGKCSEVHKCIQN